MAAHVAECSACSAFAVETESFDQLILEALNLPVPSALASFSLETPPTAAPTSRRLVPMRWLAAAAGVFAAVLVGFGALRLAAPENLGSELVAHVLHEPASLRPVASPVAAENVELVLRQTGARLNAPVGQINYMKTCPFRGKPVAHVVIEGATGPITLLLLPEIEVAAPESFDEEGFKGVIVPVGKGSVAIIGGETEPLGPVEDVVSRAVEWRI